MTAEEALRLMQEIATIRDKEARHQKADELLIQIIAFLCRNRDDAGKWASVARVFDEMEKWYG